MSSSTVQDPKKSDHGSSSATATQTIEKPYPRTLSVFTTGALRSVHQCGTCKRPISLSCARLKHVAHCKATDDSGRACGTTYSTIYGCFKHPYRDGHNPEMRAHAEIVKARIPGSASSPALSMLGKVPPALQQNSMVRKVSPLATTLEASEKTPSVRSTGTESQVLVEKMSKVSLKGSFKQ